MKILSYKILNEATVNLFNRNANALGGSISRNLLKTTRISKQRGIEGASDTLKYMTRYIQLMFNFYDAQGNAQLSSDINVAFGIYFSDSGNKAHILPYYSNSIQNLMEENLQYATLELSESGNIENIEDYFNNFQPKKFNFSLTIPNLNVFKDINNKYKFTSLNQLTQFANANSQNYLIGFNASSGFRRLTLDRGQGNQGGTSRYTSIAFIVSTPTQTQQGQINQQQVITINNVFRNGQQNCTITFNAQSQNTAIGRFVTIIQYGNNNSIEIYTTNKINQQRNLPINLGQVYIKSTSLNIPNPTLCELNITNLR